MKAVILAAGVGKRLWPVTQHRPKCLIELGGRALLHRMLDELARVGVPEVVLVVGYKQEMIREAVAGRASGPAVRFLVNEAYHRGSISSLWTAREALDDDVVIMDADVLFHGEILTRLVRSRHSDALCLDETVTQRGEECMAVIRGDRVVALTKRMPGSYDFAGEGVGFLKVARVHADRLLASLDAYIRKDAWDMEYEDALLGFFETVRVGYERIGGLPWIEIDFPDDVTRAEREILPKID